MNAGTYPYYLTVRHNAHQSSGERSASTEYVYDSSDVVRIGGPDGALGIISGLEIYNPGTVMISTCNVEKVISIINIFLAPSCNPSTCLWDFGMTNPGTCIKPKCHASCATCINANDDGCLSCSPSGMLYQGKCGTTPCPLGTYLDATSDTCQGNTN